MGERCENMVMQRCVVALMLLGAAIAAPTPQLRNNITLFSGAGYLETAYHSLQSSIDATLPSSVEELCLAHSHDGVLAALKTASNSQRCTRGLFLMGAAPTATLLASCSQPVVVIAGSLDGVSRFSNFAALRHISATLPQKGLRSFAAIRGLSHHSFAGNQPSSLSAQLDLAADRSPEEAIQAISGLVTDFLATESDSKEVVSAAEMTAAELSKPLTDALELEGSTKLGHPACNSDYPTNPKCQYPKFPDHSLPFGPAPAPSPSLPADCICGSPWVQQQATEALADFADSGDISDTKLVTNDAFQDVSDTHPFHLPHIFNSCSKEVSSACVLNTTSLTMPFAKAGDLFPSTADAPLSLYEFKSKIKSREALWDAAGQETPSSIDYNLTVCQAINQKAWDWALKHADTQTRTQFLSSGEPFVMVADVKASIGVTGPEWIADEMVYTRESSANGDSHIEVQSWYFPVANTGGGAVPWFFPVGMHYCKLLSPARAAEWIMTDGLRSKRSLSK